MSLRQYYFTIETILLHTEFCDIRACFAYFMICGHGVMQRIKDVLYKNDADRCFAKKIFHEKRLLPRTYINPIPLTNLFIYLYSMFHCLPLFVSHICTCAYRKQERRPPLFPSSCASVSPVWLIGCGKLFM